MYYPYYFDPTYLLVLAGLALSLIAQAAVQNVTRKYAAVPARCGLTGAQLARRMLDGAGLYDVAIERIAGDLTDHYDPSSRTLRLSAPVADSGSITALGVAAHETGHALQHRDAYAPLVLRSAAVPTVNIGSHLSWPLVLVGLIFSWQPLVMAGIALFALVVLFALITLPVEFNASRRALATLEGEGYLDAEEMTGARKVLRAAAMTYVASALSAILQLLRLILISGNSRRRR
ncbi:MAG: zinc metallopeptidase [Clostridia bacterium]|nr:zinc metallopeptidase [Clostridia bacterium]MBO4886127.1 zinc metallopeptidase [Clostridia bacterium]MBR4443289.1 zinc metallopeptidase [Clostridia bacterium]